jgi:hypothetical protein
MLRSVLLAVTSVAFLTATTAAMADDKSDCMKGVAMIKAELKKKHPEKVLASLRDALSNTDLEVAEEDWSECITYINKARAALRQ